MWSQHYIALESCLCKYGADTEDYWTGDRFMAQLKNAEDIVDFKYPPNHYTVVWLFDQSSCHRKFNDQALLAKNILVKDGGPRCVRDTDWARQPQSMVAESGTGKGLRTILRETCIKYACRRYACCIIEAR